MISNFGFRISNLAKGRPARVLLALAAAGLVLALGADCAWAAESGIGGDLIPRGGLEGASPKQLSTLLQIVLVTTVMTLAPAILIMMTSFTRIIIVLSFLRNAMATQQVPPYQVLSGLALFITFMVMAPTLNEAYQKGVKPFVDPEPGVQPIGHKQALERAIKPFRRFMFRQVRGKDLRLFLAMNSDTRNLKFKSRQDLMDKVPTLTLIPAFVVSELRTAFWMGFLVFIPFLVIDLVISSILLSMGMFFLPPYIVSLPFKILLFVLVDGWGLVVGSLVKSFQSG